MANRSVRDPGQLASFETSGTISTDVPAYAINTGQAAEALASVAGNLASKLGQMADKARRREGLEDGAAYGQSAGAPFLQQQAAAEAASSATSAGPWYEQAKALIRKEEGFRDTPYWDVNAHRVGYGSDTTVNAEGKIVRVTQGMRISREDAERDLDYRLTKREGAQAQRQLGAAWESLPARAKVGLASVAYNYGSLPKAVVTAAKSGDIGAIANAVAALPANAKRRAREAALIRGAGSTPSSDAGKPAAPSALDDPSRSTLAPQLSTEPLALRRDGTIYGEAFDEAALSSWGWRIQEGVRSELFGAQLDNQDDPQAFAGAAEAIRAKYAAELPNDPQAREMFDKSFQQNARAYGMNIAARHEARLRQEQEASFAAGYSAMSIDIERQAQVLGANPEGDKIVGEQVASLQRSIDGAYQQGIITPAQAEEYKRQIALTAARGRIQGVFESLPTPEAKQSYATALLDDWAKGEGALSALPRDTVKGLSTMLFNEAQRLKDADKAAKRIEQGRLKALIKDDLASMEASGTGVTDLTEAQIATALGEDAAVTWGAAREQAAKLFQATAGMEGDTETEIAERLSALAPVAGKAGYADQEEVFEAARKKADAIRKERANDPASAVQKSFPSVREAADNADPQDPASMQGLVASRLQAQESLGISDFERQPLTNAEALALARPVSTQSDAGLASKAMGELVTQVQSLYGPHADQVLKQVLTAQGIDKRMADIGAGFFRKIQRGESLSMTDRRQAAVTDETVAADRSGEPRLDPRGANGDIYPFPNWKQMQRLMSQPELAPQFDEKFGPGSAARVLTKYGPRL